jgi:hypothetical protein
MKPLSLLISFLIVAHAGAEDIKTSWPPPVESALSQSGDNRAELTKALTTVPEAQREGMKFLIENMPPPDLRTLKADYLLANTALAYEAMNATPWAKKVPWEIFFNDVLPYASLNETRDDWRKRIRDLAAPLVADCKTSSEAAHVLNSKLFGQVKLRYSTERKKPDQSALESLESGKATCSGLAIFLVDACRAVGVPARVAGTPMWTNLRGNHTWVEIWDGEWHFAGAAEPDSKGLDRGWFCGDAAKAVRDDPRFAIYASSFKKTDISFPLVWNRRIQWVPGINVTDRYTPKTAPAAPPEGKVHLLVRVLDKTGGKRVAAKVTLTDKADASLKLDGTSRDETADLNNILPFTVARGHEFKVVVESAGKTVERTVKTEAKGTGEEEIATVVIAD